MKGKENIDNYATFFHLIKREKTVSLSRIYISWFISSFRHDLRHKYLVGSSAYMLMLFCY